MDLHIERTNYLRAICAVAIVISHYSMYFSAKIFHWGLALTSAIYMFFILSGFSIAYFHWNDDETMGNMMRFLRKRILKIFPVYWIYIAITLLLDYCFDGKILTYHTKSWGDILKSAFCFPSGIFSDYPSTLIPPAWFLSYVVFFYLVYSVLRYLFGLNVFIWGERVWAILILLTSIGGGVPEFKGTMLEYFFNINYLAILIGCELANLLRNTKVRAWVNKNRFLMWIWIAIAIAAWIVTGKYIDWIKSNLAMQLFGYIIPYALIFLWGSIIEIKKGIFEKIIFAVERGLSYLSKASYSIFLTHFIMLQILMMDWGITGKLWLLYKAATPVILIANGCLGYQLIEKQINRLFNGRQMRG